jgi:hypothetical protein
MSKSRLCAALLCLALAPLVHAKTVLPDSCGDDKVQFDVKGVDDHSQPLTPEAGKALLVFVEENTEWDTLATIRLGVDGTWVGATHGSQYFLVQLTPGEHHLCASMQHKLGMGSPEHYVGMETLNAEAGKVYYYGAVVGMKVAGVYGGSGGTVNSSKKVTVQYSLMTEDEGKYRVKAGKLAISNPQH